MEKVSVTCGGTTLSLLSDNLRYEVISDGMKWQNEGRGAHLVFQRKIGRKYRWYFTPFSAAAKKQHRKVDNSIISTFSGFSVYGKKIPAVFIAKATVSENGKVDFSLTAENEGECDFKAAYYPAAFNAAQYAENTAYTVDPYRQGFILPDTHRENLKAVALMTKYWRKINTGDAYLPLFGRTCGAFGYSAFAEESFDATLFSTYGKKHTFLTAINWIGSLGKLGYERTLHMRFYKNCTYVSMAKDFRAHEKAKGNLITIDEKIAKNPNVKKLIGTPVIHWVLHEHNCPGTSVYKQTGVEDKIHYTFAQTCAVFKKYKRLGLEKAYVHTDGWGSRGYDNLHPYVLPPAKEIGGWDGMKELSDTCKALGYCFGLHDQYRDYYQDSPVYDAEKCVTDVNQNRPFCKIWAGGPHNWLCAEFALDFVKRTYTELEEHDISIDGTYLDVFGIMWGDECYHKAHRITRKESIADRGKCFDWLRERGIIVSSEELGCQMVKYLDLLHHAPYGVTPQGGGKAIGIGVPLANLVYHDCVFVPWITNGRGGWGIPDTDSGRLHCILNAQTPYFDAENSDGKLSDAEIAERIKSTQEAASVNAGLYNRELVNHEFLDKTYRVQRTTFSDGTQITVDFDKDTYEIHNL